MPTQHTGRCQPNLAVKARLTNLGVGSVQDAAALFLCINTTQSTGYYHKPPSTNKCTQRQQSVVLLHARPHTFLQCRGLCDMSLSIVGDLAGQT